MIPKNLDEIRRDIVEAKRNAREDDARKNELVEQLRLSLAKAEADRDRLRQRLNEAIALLKDTGCSAETLERLND